MDVETVKRRKIVVVCTALLAHSAASSGYAACVVTSEIAARARFLRCEDAKYHLEASGAYAIYERALEDILARSGSQNPRVVRERLGLDRNATSLLPADYEARVAVVIVDWRVSTAPWTPGVSETASLMGQPQELHEIVRYWWRGPSESCDNLAEGTRVDLWIHSPCCDTIPGEPPCVASMLYAEPAPEPMSEALALVLDDQ